MPLPLLRTCFALACVAVLSGCGLATLIPNALVTKPSPSPSPTGVGSCVGVTPPKRPPSGVLTVYVTDERDQPMAEVAIDIAMAPATGYHVLCSPAAMPPTYTHGKTDAQGRYKSPLPLQVGPYVIKAELNGAKAEGRVQVVEDPEGAVLELKLKPTDATVPAERPATPATGAAS